MIRNVIPKLKGNPCYSYFTVSVPIEPNRTELLVRFGFGSSNLSSGSGSVHQTSVQVRVRFIKSRFRFGSVHWSKGLVRVRFGSSNLSSGSGSVRFNHVMLYFISKKSVTIAYVRKSFFAATNCNKIVFSSTEIVTKSLFFTLISQDKVFNYITTSYQSYNVNTIKGLPRVTPPPKLRLLRINLIIKNEYKMITKNECEKSLLKTNVKTIIKMNVRSLLK